MTTERFVPSSVFVGDRDITEFVSSVELNTVTESEPLTMDVLRDAYERLTTGPWWECVANPADVTDPPEGARLSEYAPRGQVLAFDRRVLSPPFLPGGVVPMRATVEFEERPRDILERIDETLTYYSAALGEEVTVPVPRDGVFDGMPTAYGAAPGSGVADAAEAFGVQLEGWQRYFLNQFTTAMGRFEVAFQQRVVPSIEALGAVFRGLELALSESERRRVRLRAMRHAYRQRRRGRW
jgi:hypothetical protein